MIGNISAPLGDVVTREELASHVWGIANGGTGTSSALSAFYALFHRGEIPNHDFDDAISTGLYHFDKNDVNGPEDDYGILIVLVSASESYNYTDNWLWQIAISTGANMFIRQRLNSGAFTEWVLK